MYMKISDRINAEMNSPNVFSNSFPRRATRVAIGGRHIHGCGGGPQRFDTVGQRIAWRNPRT